MKTGETAAHSTEYDAAGLYITVPANGQ